jgi:2-polyprenyl-6-methoxyphenol hydroxylase-like FAD-dependent oxidoreductase
MTTTLVERSSALRTGGYIIDFWGAGFDIAERMGLLNELRQHGYLVREVRVVNRQGRRVSGFPVDIFTRLTENRYISLPRGDLAAMIYRKIENEVETIFGDSVQSIEQSDRGVRVGFEHGGSRDFDLVIGADGLHSRVRELTFGPQEKFEKYLGYKVAAFEAKGYRPRDELTYLMYTEVGQQVGRFTMRDDRTFFLFIYTDDDPNSVDVHDRQAQKIALHRHFENSGWECPRILDALDATEDLYFDRVSQIRMNPADGLWTRGRVSLVGDAASCVSLLAGQGSALAMVGAYILAGELHRANGDHSAAFERYQKMFGPFVANKQRAAERFAGAFAPKSKLGLLFRNQVMKALRIPWIADLVVGRDFLDRIALPEY